MAQAVYSLRIFAAATLTSSSGLVGPIVPDNLIYIVRDIDAWDNSASASNQLEVFNPLGGFLWVAFGSTSDPLRNQQWRGRQVYSPGERVGFSAAGGSWAVACSGYQLSLP